jgi:DNA-binding IclR family transcriptional regulator
MPRPSPQTDRVVQTVEMLAASAGALSLSEIARRLGLTPSTCSPMIARLERAGWLVRHPVTLGYRLGPGLIAAGLAASGGSGALQASRPVLMQLHEDLRCTGVALVADERSAVVVDIVRDPRDGPSALRMGDEIPMRPPLGLTFMAWQSAAVVAEWLRRGGVTAGSEDDKRYWDLLEITRRRGYSVESASSIDARTRGEVVELLRIRLGHEPSAREEPDPAALRALMDDFVSRVGAHAAFDLGRLDPEAAYDVDSISAPVFRGDGQVALILNLRNIAASKGADIMRIGDRLVAAAATATRAIGGAAPTAPVSH